MKDIEEANDTYILSQFDNYKSYQASAMGPTGHHYLEQSRKKSPIPSPNPHSIKYLIYNIYIYIYIERQPSINLPRMFITAIIRVSHRRSRLLK